MIVVIDTETTGFPKSGENVQHGQARVLQLAALMCDDNGKHMGEFSTLIRLNGDTQVTTGAQDVHGISWEACDKFGIPSINAMSTLMEMMRHANLAVFHNKSFDMRMIEIEAAHLNLTLKWPETYCTMMASMDICKLPGMYGNYKWPKLAEALPIICGREIGNDAHDAMVDAKGAKDLYFKLIEMGVTHDGV